jgi:hypothetical protein
LFKATEGLDEGPVDANQKRILGDIEMQGDMYEAKRVSRDQLNASQSKSSSEYDEEAEEEME